MQAHNLWQSKTAFFAGDPVIVIKICCDCVIFVEYRAVW